MQADRSRSEATRGSETSLSSPARLGPGGARAIAQSPEATGGRHADPLGDVEPTKFPGASTLRLTRTWRQRPKLRRRSASKRAAARKGQKPPERHPHVVARLLTRLPHRPVQEDTLNAILAWFAHASAACGLIDPANLHVAGDATPITSRTDSHGKRAATARPAPSAPAGGCSPTRERPRRPQHVP